MKDAENTGLQKSLSDKIFGELWSQAGQSEGMGCTLQNRPDSYILLVCRGI